MKVDVLINFVVDEVRNSISERLNQAIEWYLRYVLNISRKKYRRHLKVQKHIKGHMSLLLNSHQFSIW